MKGMQAHVLLALLLAAGLALAEVGDPQTKTEHPWYPGELSCSTFERLFKTEADLYTRITGRKVDNDEDKALAAWYWRNLNYFHADDGQLDYWGKGFKTADYNRDFWTGLFAHGFGLCYTTHAQWCGEMEYLLGHCRARACGVPGHTSFEVFLTGGAYGDGAWVLLDHDISTVMFKEDGSRLISIQEIAAEYSKYKEPSFKPERQRGWLVGGLHPSDPKAYDQHKTNMYFYGYAGSPPLVHLRAGETLRRYLKPGLEDGRTFVYWGLNYKTITNMIGPERNRTWVNQPEKMYKAKQNTPMNNGQARYANAVYTYKPDFTGKYKEGVIDESDKHVTFAFVSPYVVGCTPTDAESGTDKWGIYETGGKNGLVLKGKMTCPVKISLDYGKNWKEAGNATDGMDLTELAKGTRQYWIRFESAPAALAGSDLTMITTCQCSPCVIPRLADGKNPITFQASGTAVVHAGPTVPQAEARVVDGKIGTPTVTLELATPHKEKAVQLYANAHVASGSPPRDCTYQIEFSTDGGQTWKPVVKDWKILRRGKEAGDFWSQSMCFGTVALEGDVTGPVRVRFKNDGGRTCMRVEASLVYKVAESGPVDVTYAWKEGGGELKKASHTFAAKPGEEDKSWTIDCGAGVQTVWVEYAAK
jgi:hypothetical protein